MKTYQSLIHERGSLQLQTETQLTLGCQELRKKIFSFGGYWRIDWVEVFSAQEHLPFLGRNKSLGCGFPPEIVSATVSNTKGLYFPGARESVKEASFQKKHMEAGTTGQVL